ncbi:MAG: tyrosine-type recombinase/integrase [Candidatus Korobacteraceae bacterium]
MTTKSVTPVILSTRQRFEVAKLVKKGGGTPWILFMISLQTGLRKMELQNLLWDDLDLENQSLRVFRAKTGAVYVAPISEMLCKALKEHKAGTQSTFVFGPRREKVLDKALRSWREAARVARVPRFRFQDMRHMCAQRLIFLVAQVCRRILQCR